MSFDAIVYQVMIASPSDVINERQLVRKIIHKWNAVQSSVKHIILLPVGWEYDTTPTMGNGPQEIINKQLLEGSDLLIGIFCTRIGTPTKDAISGTVEEIEKHIEEGKPTMLYFSNVPAVPASIDQKQYKTLTKFKKECQKKGLVETYDSYEDFSEKFDRQLAILINKNDYFKTYNKLKIEKLPEYNDNLNYKLIQALSKEAKELLIEASKDESRTVRKQIIGKTGGIALLTNGKNLVKEDTPRVQALWESALQELLDNDLLVEQGFSGTVFKITHTGYQTVDNFNKKN